MKPGIKLRPTPRAYDWKCAKCHEEGTEAVAASSKGIDLIQELREDFSESDHCPRGGKMRH